MHTCKFSLHVNSRVLNRGTNISKYSTIAKKTIEKPTIPMRKDGHFYGVNV